MSAALCGACLIPSLCHAESSSTTKATTADDNTRLQALFRKGVKAFEAGKNEEAVQVLSEAWAIRQTYDIGAMLAQGEIQLKRYRDAAEHLDFALSHFAPVESEQTLEQMRTAFAEVKSHVAILRINVDRAGAALQLDGRALGVAPLAAPQFVDPGVHTVQAQSNGESASAVVNVDAGAEYPVELRLAAETTAEPGPVVLSANAGPVVADTAQKRSVVPVIVAGAVAAVGTAGLIGFSLAASSDADKLAQLKRQNGPAGCADGTATPADCSAQLDAAHSHDKHKNLAVASAIVGAAGLVAIPIYWFWPRNEHRAEAARSSGLRVRGAAGVGSISVFGEF